MQSTEGGSIPVVVVDDQQIIREAFGTLISQDPTIELVGSLKSGTEAIEMVPVLNPSVVVMDVKMPGIDGLAAARRIREERPDIGIVLLTSFEDNSYIQEFMKDDPGGKAYLLKHTLGTMDELIRTIHDVAAGRTVLDPIMVEKLTAPRGTPETSALKKLTRRELEVLALMAKACTNSTIASILHIQPRTVEHHISNIFGKLDIGWETDYHARVQAVLTYLSVNGDAADASPGAAMRDPAVHSPASDTPRPNGR